MHRLSGIGFVLITVGLSGNVRAEPITDLVGSRWLTSSGCEIVEFYHCSTASNSICGKVVEVDAAVKSTGLESRSARTAPSLGRVRLIERLQPVSRSKRDVCQINDRWKLTGQYYSWQSGEQTTIFMQPLLDGMGRLKELKVKTCTNRMRDRRTGCNIDRRLRWYERTIAKLVAGRVRYCSGAAPPRVTATCAETPAWRRVTTGER